MWVALAIVVLSSHLSRGSEVSPFDRRVTSLLEAAPKKLLHAAKSKDHGGSGSPGTGSRVSGLHCSPAEHGGDPFGVKDSTEALQGCVDWCVNQSLISPNGVFPGLQSLGYERATGDMGGCFVDLEGGEYRVSASVRIPEYTANMNLGYGSIVAGPGMGSDNFLIVVGNATSDCVNLPQGSCNMDINFPALFVDGSNKASGIQINNIMGATIGPGGYFLNFSGYGVQINKGHEVLAMPRTII